MTERTIKLLEQAGLKITGKLIYKHVFYYDRLRIHTYGKKIIAFYAYYPVLNETLLNETLKEIEEYLIVYVPEDKKVAYIVEAPKFDEFFIRDLVKKLEKVEREGYSYLITCMAYANFRLKPELVEAPQPLIDELKLDEVFGMSVFLRELVAVTPRFIKSIVYNEEHPHYPFRIDFSPEEKEPHFTLKKQLIFCLTNISKYFIASFFQENKTIFFNLYSEGIHLKKNFVLKDYKCSELYDELINADIGFVFKMAIEKFRYRFPGQYFLFLEKNKELVIQFVHTLASMSLLDRML